MRRSVHVVAGVLALDVVVMVGMWTRMQDDQCDTRARGLVVENDRGGWETVSVGTDPDPSLGPCRGRVDLTVSAAQD